MIDYGHGDDLYKYGDRVFKANFSSNVWYQGAPKKLVKYIQQQLPHIENYPAPSAEYLVKTIEKHHGISSNSTIVTNGATEAFYLVANAFHSASVTICMPSFSEYEQASKANNLQIEFIHRNEVLQHEFTTTLAFICNPNNPDGFENTVEEIVQLSTKFPNTIFIIDEAYTEFTKNAISCGSLLKSRTNIILIKSLTKLFCIPGLRLGYLLANPTLIAKLIKHKMPWNVNTIALQAGEFLFQNYSELAPDFKTCFQHTKALQKAIHALEGFEVIPTDTTYFLVKLSEPKATALKSYLVNEHQLLIRDASNFRTLDAHYIRIASQTPEKNQLLINALQQWNP
ncbi:aminotransferase class I/II-fold pyridoxal phosphate-dependent enzyme [Kordia sp.]|uniref:pyridoxal phosphate-dependent aminotransferase n=1 Tax=Kordia sp. TaxID=1965332 RepID=UPI0025BA55FA|nr:aminotransferase class I/II-fold pyridoxal phosphate-dependent enzyme [Kordia sp.]MCH2194822.1 aminotransferase class I/II-fold pyridoxal phosphate-dependent enzyme [Kordia sp.]